MLELALQEAHNLLQLVCFQEFHKMGHCISAYGSNICFCWAAKMTSLSLDTKMTCSDFAIATPGNFEIWITHRSIFSIHLCLLQRVFRSGDGGGRAGVVTKVFPSKAMSVCQKTQNILRSQENIRGLPCLQKKKTKKTPSQILLCKGGWLGIINRNYTFQ